MINMCQIKNKIIIGIILILIITNVTSISVNSNKINKTNEPAPGIVWSKTYGGVSTDHAFSVQQTPDDGFIIAGDTLSFGSGGYDAWLIKTDSEGNELWNKTYGGINEDVANCVIVTSDGGYAIAGYKEIYEDKFELWVIKTDENGNMIWNKTYEKGEYMFGICIIENSQGYTVVSKGNGDIWLVGIDKNGVMIWDNTFGGIETEWAYRLIQDFNDDGYVIVGSTFSFGHGDSDIWLIKTNETGVMLWNKTYGGTGFDTGSGVVQTFDGGFAITGGITPQGSGFRDACVIRTDENGNELWCSLFGGYDLDSRDSIIQTMDGDYLIAGATHSYGPKGFNGWVVKADENGDEIWNVSFGGNDDEGAACGVQSNDGGFVIAGGYDCGDGSDDAWLVKIGYAPVVTIVKPVNGLYFKDFLIRTFLFSFRNPLIIGPINVEVEVVVHKYEIEKVEFYINDELMLTETSEPYSMNWSKTMFGRYIVKVVAYNSIGYTGSDVISVWKFF